MDTLGGVHSAMASVRPQDTPNAQVTSKYIASNVRKARLINLVGLAGAENVQGEDQKKLDVLSNDIMVNALRASGKVSVMVSEEIDEAIIVKGSKGT